LPFLPVQAVLYTPAGSTLGANAAVMVTTTTNPASTTLKASTERLCASAAGSAGPECAALGDPAKEAVPAKDFIAVDRQCT
jgi:hypothetical protein